MVTLVGSRQTGELGAMGFPVEVSAVHNCTAYLCGVAVHIFGGGVGNDVASPFEGTAVNGCGEGVVDNQGNAVTVSHLGKTLDVEHVAARVGDGFAKEAFRVGTELLLDALVVPVRVDECALYAQFLHGHTKEVIGAAIDVGRGDEMVACLADVEHGIEVCRLSA